MTGGRAGEEIVFARDVNGLRGVERWSGVLAEEVGVVEHQLDRVAIAPEPAGGDEDGGGDVVGDEGLEDAMVGLAAAGIKREGHMRLLVGHRMGKRQPGLGQRRSCRRRQGRGQENQSGGDQRARHGPICTPNAPQASARSATRRG